MVTLLLAFFLVAGAGPAQTDFRYDVLHWKTWKHERGQLQIGASGIEYYSADGKTSIRVPFVNIRQMDVSDPSEIRIETYQMLKRKLSGRRTYVFRLRSPRSAQDNESLVRFLSNKLSRPILASYSTADKPEFEIPAYHRHLLSGCNGTLQITPQGIRFLSETEPHSRTWLYSEIQTIGGSDPFSFRITTSAETYTFDLKQRLPKQAYDAVWQRVYDLRSKYSAVPPAVPDRRP